MLCNRYYISADQIVTNRPTNSPTPAPSAKPTHEPTSLPTKHPTRSPSSSSTTQSSPTISPTKMKLDALCGDAVCDSDETPKTCSADCAVKDFAPNSKNDANSNGQMFTIEAISDLTITSFDISSKKKANSQVMVYTRGGDYSGHETNSDEWELILDRTIQLDNKKTTSIGDLDRGVSVPAGSAQSFFIWTKNGMLYTKSEAAGTPFASDPSLVIKEGIGMKNLFDKATGTGKFSGVIRYVLIFH